MNFWVTVKKNFMKEIKSVKCKIRALLDKTSCTPAFIYIYIYIEREREKEREREDNNIDMNSS